jgi:hypothetical protein
MYTLGNGLRFFLLRILVELIKIHKFQLQPCGRSNHVISMCRHLLAALIK